MFSLLIAALLSQTASQDLFLATPSTAALLPTPLSLPACNASQGNNSPNCIHPQFPASDLRLLAWVGGDIDNPENRNKHGGMKAVVQQLQNNPGLYTGLMGFCGWAFAPNGSVYVKNITKWGQCAGTVNGTRMPIPGGADLFAEVKRQKMEFQPVISMDDPWAAMANSAPYIKSFAAVAKAEGWTGFNLDWEGTNTTGNRTNFLNFCKLMNDFADGLHVHGLEFSTDVQYVTQPYGSKPDTELDALLGAGRAKWITMDTYYYSTGRVIDALDFYATRVSRKRLGIGMSSFEPSPNYDGFVARFHALRSYGIRELDMFAMPTNETWMPWLRKWKNDCRGCPSGGALSCFANTECY
jgi:hypothetical protein